MKLIGRIIWKDIVRERWLLGLWFGLLGLRMGLGWGALHRGGDLLDWESYHDFLMLVQAGLTYFLAVRWVQADGLIGPKAVWVTRPISPVRLFTAKMLGLLLAFGILPALLQIPWWRHCHFEWHVVGLSALIFFGWQLLVLAPAFLVGTLTDEAGRVLLASLALILGLLAWTAWLQPFLPWMPVEQIGWGGSSFPLWYSRFVPGVAAFVIGAGLIGMHQYLTRRWGRSLLLCGLGYVGLMLIGAYWPVNLPAWKNEGAGQGDLNATSKQQLASVGVQSAGPARVSKSSSEKSVSTVTLEMMVPALPKDLRVMGGWAEQTWSWKDRVSLTKIASAYGNDQYSAYTAVLRDHLSLPAPSIDEETKRSFDEFQAAKEARLMANGRKVPARSAFPSRNDHGRLTVFSGMPLSLLEKTRMTPPSLTMTMHLAVSRPEVQMVVPLNSTDVVVANSASCDVKVRFDSDVDQPGHRLECMTTRSAIDQSAPFVNGISRLQTFASSNWPPRRSFFLVNRSTGEIQRASYRAGYASRSIQICGVLIVRENWAMKPDRVIRNGQWVVQDPQWQEHTSLVLMRDRKVARIEREVRTDRFEVEPTERK